MSPQPEKPTTTGDTGERIARQAFGSDHVGPFNWVVVLMGSRNPYDGEGGLRVVRAKTVEQAVREAHERPPSTVAVKFAWVHRLAEPYNATLIPADVPSPEWGTPKRSRQ